MPIVFGKELILWEKTYTNVCVKALLRLTFLPNVSVIRHLIRWNLFGLTIYPALLCLISERERKIKITTNRDKRHQLLFKLQATKTPLKPWPLKFHNCKSQENKFSCDDSSSSRTLLWIHHLRSQHPSFWTKHSDL